MTEKQIRAYIASAISDRLYPSDHAKQRMQEREISMRQVITVLQKGTLVDGPKHNDEKGSWEVKIRSWAAGFNISVVVAIYVNEDEVPVVVITVINHDLDEGQ